MTLAIENVAVPLTVTSEGSVRVSGTRVPLDTVVHAFNAGGSAEDIASDYPSLKLQDVYAVISFYLQHRSDVDSYLSAREDEATRIRNEIEARQERNQDLKTRLLARKQQRAKLTQ